MNIQIIKASSSDLFSIVDIARRTFIETYDKFNTRENMNLYLENTLCKSKLQVELENPHSNFYIVKSSNEVIGYLKVNEKHVQTEFKEEDSLEIERIYVLKAFHFQGIGKMLIKKTIQFAKFKGKKKIWLGVWKENKEAIRFYQKLGFSNVGEHVFVFGNERQIDLVLKLNI